MLIGLILTLVLSQSAPPQTPARMSIAGRVTSGTPAHPVPNAVVGYQPGYGEVDDVYPQSSDGSYTHDRLVLMVAVKNNVALVAEALGPYDPASPGGSSDTGHPTGVSLAVAAFLLDPLVNSFMWHGDPPR